MPVRCFNCHELIVAPAVSAYVTPDRLQHIWHCCDCFAVFEASVLPMMMLASEDRDASPDRDAPPLIWVAHRGRLERYDTPRF